MQLPHQEVANAFRRDRSCQPDTLLQTVLADHGLQQLPLGAIAANHEVDVWMGDAHMLDHQGQQVYALN